MNVTVLCNSKVSYATMKQLSYSLLALLSVYVGNFGEGRHFLHDPKIKKP